MRKELLKLNKRNSTKSERKISEIFKNNHIKFEFRKKIGKYEADFVCGKVIFEIDGNIHDKIRVDRDVYFSNNGYVPIHLNVKDGVKMEQIEKIIKKLIK